MTKDLAVSKYDSFPQSVSGRSFAACAHKSFSPHMSLHDLHFFVCFLRALFEPPFHLHQHRNVALNVFLEVIQAHRRFVRELHYEVIRPFDSLRSSQFRIPASPPTTTPPQKQEHTNNNPSSTPTQDRIDLICLIPIATTKLYLPFETARSRARGTTCCLHGSSRRPCPAASRGAAHQNRPQSKRHQMYPLYPGAK